MLNRNICATVSIFIIFSLLLFVKEIATSYLTEQFQNPSTASLLEASNLISDLSPLNPAPTHLKEPFRGSSHSSGSRGHGSSYSGSRGHGSSYSGHGSSYRGHGSSYRGHGSLYSGHKGSSYYRSGYPARSYYGLGTSYPYYGDGYGYISPDVVYVDYTPSLYDNCHDYAYSQCNDSIFPERCYANYYEKCRLL